MPQFTEKASKKKRFKSYPIGYFHIVITEVQTEEGNLYPLVAIDRTSKFTFVEVHEQATRPIAAEFLHHLLTAVPYKIHTILTDNGIQFANRQGDKYAFQLLFDQICLQNSIEHRLTKPKHPWTNGQVERLTRILKDATVKRYYYTHQQLRDHLVTFLMAYNFAKRLKSLKGLTPYEYICHQWQQQPERFLFDPSHLTLGLHKTLISLFNQITRKRQARLANSASHHNSFHSRSSIENLNSEQLTAKPLNCFDEG